MAADAVFNAVMLLTQQRDLYSLDWALVRLLTETFNAHSATLYEVLDSRDKGPLARCVATRQGLASERQSPSAVEGELISLQQEPALAACLALQPGEALSSQAAEGLVSVFPLSRGTTPALLSMQGVGPGEAAGFGLNYLFQIYENCARVLSSYERDSLTRLLNRRSFDQRLERIMQTIQLGRGSHERERHHCFAVLDIDHFKRVNDRFGHLYGDEVLLLFASLMRNTFRSEDLLFRFGGEEFVVVLSDVELGTARQILDRFRQRVEQYDFPQVGRVTASVGVAEIHPATAAGALFDAADKALYYAKEHGRNRICLYEELVAAGELEGPSYSDDIELF